MKQHKINVVIPIVVGAVCLLNVIQFVQFFDYGSLTSVVLGTSFILLYILRGKAILPLFTLWVLAMVPYFARPTFLYLPNTGPITFVIGSNSADSVTQLNLVPLLLFILAPVMAREGLIGRIFTVHIAKNSNGGLLTPILPLKTAAIGVSKISNGKRKWVKLQLPTPITNGANEYDFLNIRTTNGSLYKKGKWQSTLARLSSDVHPTTLSVKGNFVAGFE